jgi:hypothetical protein
MSNHLVVSPNPFSNELNVEYYLENADAVSLTIVDIAGKKVFQGSVNSPAGLQNWTLKDEISELQAGTYIVTLTSGGRQVQTKVVKF